jgi:DNA glycosylase AlkZ-like
MDDNRRLPSSAVPGREYTAVDRECQHRPRLRGTRERVLTRRDLNRALLARQLLTERAGVALPRVVERMGGIQAQYAPSAYIALWSRVEGFERSALTRALERKALVQATVLRGTIHVVSRRDFWPWRTAVHDTDEAWLRRVRPDLAGRHRATADRKLRAALADGPRKRDELVALVSKDGWFAASVDLVRVPPSGTWEQRRADLYALAESWIGPNDADAESARELLVRRYLAAFGPASVPDVRSWSRLTRDQVERALERIGARTFRDEDEKALFDVPRAPLPHADTPAPPRFLPTWDAVLLVHARRTGVLPEEYRPRIFNTKLPFSMHTFLLDGSVAGAWKVERAKDKAELVLQPFAPVPRNRRDPLRDEAERLVRWHEDDAVSYAVRWTKSTS